MNFSGITTALITPFYGGKLDKKSCLNLLENQVQNGITQFVINGTTGESPCLEESEVASLCSWFHQFKSEKNQDLKLILGTGTFSTKVSLEKTKQAKTYGADAVLIVTPYYNRPSQEGFFCHFQLLSEATTLPIILYNVPSRTCSSLSLATIKKLSLIPNIIGIKEASGDLKFLKEIKQACGEEFLFLSGDDFTAIDSFFLGGNGVISVASHVIGQEFKNFFERSLKKDQTVLKEFEKYKNFLDELYKQTNPIGIKQLLKKEQVIQSDELRLPLKAPKEINPLLQEAFLKIKKDAK